MIWFESHFFELKFENTIYAALSIHLSILAHKL
jgi:hypothetical protein